MNELRFKAGDLITPSDPLPKFDNPEIWEVEHAFIYLNGMTQDPEGEHVYAWYGKRRYFFKADLFRHATPLEIIDYRIDRETPWRKLKEKLLSSCKTGWETIGQSRMLLGLARLTCRLGKTNQKSK